MEERLEQLMKAAQQEILQNEEPSLALVQLVEEILRSRKVGRAPKGQPLSGVYQEICDRVRQQLLNDVAQALKSYRRSTYPCVREWARHLQHQAFRQILDDDQLKRLALEAQQNPPRSELRQHALVQLVEAIRLSGRLAHPHRAKFSPQFYELLYEEAVNKTLIYICRHIDTYDPERGQNKKFMNWVNFRLDRVLIECRQEFNEKNVQGLPSLKDLETIAEFREEQPLSDLIKDYIDSDTENLFKRAYIRNRPDANFRAIALARLAEKSWEEISAEMKIKIPTLSSFFQRCCDKFAPKFQELL